MAKVITDWIGKKKGKRGITVQIYDPNTKENKSFTVHGMNVGSIYDIVFTACNREAYEGVWKIWEKKQDVLWTVLKENKYKKQ